MPKKTFKNQKNCTPHWGLSPVWFSGHGGCRFVFFLGGLCGFWPFGSKNAKNLQRRKKLHTSTIHLFRLQALHCTDIFFVMFWLLIFRGLTRVVWTWNIYITLIHTYIHTYLFKVFAPSRKQYCIPHNKIPLQNDVVSLEEANTILSDITLFILAAVAWHK